MTPSASKSVGAAALLLAASVALSRVIGFLRDALLANLVGAGPVADAYFAAFMLPDLLNYFLAGGALSIAFIPFYTRVRDREGEEAAAHLFHTVLSAVALVALVGTALLFVNADALIAFQFASFAPETKALATRLTRIVLPAQLFFLTGGILRAVLMAHGHFGAQAAAPLLYNGAVIAAGLATGTAEGFAWGVVLGALLGNWLLPVVDLLRTRAVPVDLALPDRRFLSYLWLAAPLMLGLSLTTVDEWYDKWFGATLGPGTVAALSYARKLAMAPVGIVGQAVAAAALPMLSGLYARGQRAELDDTLQRVLESSLVLAVFAAGAVFALAAPGVDVLYRHGRFEASDAERVTFLLRVMAFGVPAWVIQQIAVRAFYAREDTWRPMILGTLVAASAVPLYLGLGRELGAAGLAGAGVLAMSVNALATLAWSKLRHGAPALGALLGVALRAGLLTIPAAALVFWATPPSADFAGSLAALALATAGYGGLLLVAVGIGGDATSREGLAGLLKRARLGGLAARLQRVPR